jgi:hypothetical protein
MQAGRPTDRLLIPPNGYDLSVGGNRLYSGSIRVEEEIDAGM